MSRRLVIAAVLSAVAAVGPLATQASADSYRHYDRRHYDSYYHDRWRGEWRNREDARRAGVVAGVVVGGVAEAAARDRAEQRYRECMLVSGYDYDCDRRRYEDEYRSRQIGRRAGVVAGVTAHAIVRD